jgi:hypothetical protein
MGDHRVAPFHTHVEQLAAAIEDNRAGLPELARSILRVIVAQLDDTQAKIRQIEAKLAQWRFAPPLPLGARLLAWLARRARWLRFRLGP